MLEPQPNKKSKKRFFINRPQIKHNETLASWFIRVVLKNHYPSVEWVLRYVGQLAGNSYSNVDQLNDDTNSDWIHTLAGLTLQDTEKLYNHTFYGHFSTLQRKQDKAVQWEYKDAYKINQYLIHARPRICPLCIKYDPYVRLEWYLDCYEYCHIHHIWLVDTCLNCGQQIQSHDIVQNRCSNCRNSLSVSSIKESTNNQLILSVQNELLNWVTTGKVIQKYQLTQPLNVVLAILVGLADTLKNVEEDFLVDWLTEESDTSNIISPIGAIGRYAIGYNIILDWDKNFPNFLKIYRGRKRDYHTYGFTNEFGILYSKWLLENWNTSAFQFVHDAFNRYLCQHIVPYERLWDTHWLAIHPDLLNKSDFISMKQAHEELGLSPLKILTALQSGSLSLYRSPDGVIEYVRKSELMKFDLI